MPKLSGISHQRAVNAFKKAGFWITRQGKHTTMGSLVTNMKSSL